MKKILATIGVIALSLALAAPASAHTGTGARLKLYTEGSGAEIGWSQGPDSPLDSNTSAVNIRTDAGEFAYLYNGSWLSPLDDFDTFRNASGIINMSFDFLNAAGGGYVNAGAPRFSIIVDTNGDDVADLTLFPSAFYCQAPTSNPNWSRADFTGQTAPGCLFYDSKGATYASDGTHSAWDAFVAAHPGSRVDSAWLIVDEQTAPGRARIDRIAMGKHMQSSATSVRHCNFDAAC